jgi:START domain
MRLLAVLVLIGFPALLGVARAEDPNAWRTLSAEDGITVSSRSEPGSEVSTFRGQAKLRGSILHLLAILVDDVRSKEWQDQVAEGRLLRSLDGPRSQLVYSRSRQTWPVKDRELVMQRTVDVIDPGRVYRVHLVCAPDAVPAKKGMVRVADCDTSFLLRKIDEGTTFVDASVRVDPGGSTPSWLANMAQKNIPRDTLTSLQKQAARTAGQYAAEIELWASAK